MCSFCLWEPHCDWLQSTARVWGWQGWKGHSERMNAQRTLLKFGIFHPSTNNEATGILTQLPEQRTGATAANIVSPPEAGRGRTALDIISFAVENKSIEKASFQSSNTITGSITLILVWGGLVSATWYVWGLLCFIYFFLSRRWQLQMS